MLLLNHKTEVICVLNDVKPFGYRYLSNMSNVVGICVFAAIVIGAIILVIKSKNKKKLLQNKLDEKFPDAWQAMLNRRVLFYQQLNDIDKRVFEKRVQLFLATKDIEGVETKIDDDRVK